MRLCDDVKKVVIDFHILVDVHLIDDLLKLDWVVVLVGSTCIDELSNWKESKLYTMYLYQYVVSSYALKLCGKNISTVEYSGWTQEIAKILHHPWKRKQNGRRRNNLILLLMTCSIRHPNIPSGIKTGIQYAWYVIHSTRLRTGRFCAF